MIRSPIFYYILILFLHIKRMFESNKVHYKIRWYWCRIISHIIFYIYPHKYECVCEQSMIIRISTIFSCVYVYMCICISSRRLKWGQVIKCRRRQNLKWLLLCLSDNKHQNIVDTHFNWINILNLFDDQNILSL